MLLYCRRLYIIQMLKKLAIESEKLAIHGEKLSFQNIKLAIDCQVYNEPTKKTY